MSDRQIIFSEEEILEIISSIDNAPVGGYQSVIKNKQSQTLPFRKMLLKMNEKHLIGGADTEAAGLLPPITVSDEGKFLRVVKGKWEAYEIPFAEDSDF